MANGNRKTRLELTWIGKENRPRLEPRVLLEDPAKSYHAARRVTDHDLFDNRLIFGDNLLALKALEQEFAGKIKCIFIDPPYNTGAAFEHYDDGVERRRDRLDLLRRPLTAEGSLWITIDDTECHYLKILCDEVFGRASFVISVAWEKDQGRRNDTDFSSAHDHILVYAKDREVWRSTRNMLPRTDALNARYKNPDNDSRGPWLQGDNGTAKSGTERLRFPVTLPSGRVVKPPSGNYWRFSEESFAVARREGRVWFGRSGDSLPVIKRYLSEVQDGVVPRSWWPADEAGCNQSAKRDHLRKLLPDIEPFATPKPEELLHRILTISTNQDDWVLDSFAGSGTTGAVAHKMGRRWIMVELGDHCQTHIIPRLKKVIDGEDPGGVTEAVAWKGGGGFRYYTLAPSLLQKDRYSNWIINKKYNAAMLAEAVCKLAGFVYAPSDSVYWQHGHSTETDFIYVTTQPLTREQLARLSEEVGEKRTLMIYCTAFRVKATAFPNLTLKKIPKAVLSKCEWGHDDYSLEIKNLPAAAPLEEGELLPAARLSNGRRGRRAEDDQPGLFDNAGHGEPAPLAGRDEPTPRKEGRR